ncbi:molybdenum ABC transporter ATP-binding protein [Pseudobacteriovorax antillogorgiicola]|uniref:Molybdate transport system ATP-binding protein n=1 Tax=Pseudobacteriovorax antillogorgiicola TaxID=1513793 RepID=A0A1Y6C9G4_9BACT|nr:molybdenum ABC transporter ATP-binding protein [Pseudobacteriovorax antillogorgiicola]TCS49019.1 molybdate transport system ATP-binding protein [Pseudobacteriovorax antillogorgiicola]SMF52974.1 molybdate transport system ATP-binding protein [Pseudobacteriovorax antillogorgiicola]
MSRLSINIRRALSDFSLDIALDHDFKGVTAVIGPSGAGKTSFLQCLAGFVDGRGIQIKVNGEIWNDTERGIIRQPHQRRLGYIFQSPYLFPHLSVEDNLFYGMKRRGQLADDEIAQVIHSLSIQPLLRRSPSALSGGEKQRVALARSLLTKPDLWILDEPMSALDKKSRQEVITMIRPILSLSSAPSFYVSHALDEVAQMADSVLVIDRGQVKFFGSIDEANDQDLGIPGLQNEPGVILEGVVKDFDEEYGLLRLNIDHQDIFLPARSRPSGQRHRFRILRKDVSLCLSCPSSSSVLNQIPCIVIALKPASDYQTHVKLAFGKHILWATLTRKSVDNLRLEPGVSVTAMIKAVSLLGTH